MGKKWEKVRGKSHLPIALLDFILSGGGLDAQLVVELGFFHHGEDEAVCLAIHQSIRG